MSQIKAGLENVTFVHLISGSSGHAIPLTQQPDWFRIVSMAVIISIRLVSFAVLAITAFFIVSQLGIPTTVVMVNVSMIVD